MKVFIKNIRELIRIDDGERKKIAGKAMAGLMSLRNAYLYIENGKIKDLGEMALVPDSLHSLFSTKEVTVIDASERTVLPAWCDSHTHLVFPASRESYGASWSAKGVTLSKCIFEQKSSSISGYFSSEEHTDNHRQLNSRKC